MIAVPQQLYSTHVISALLLTSLRLASPLSAAANLKLLGSPALTLFFYLSFRENLACQDCPATRAGRAQR